MTTATQQAQALRRPEQLRQPAPPASMGASVTPDMWSQLPRDVQQQIETGYGTGGFEGVKNIPGWYELPEHERTQLLIGMRG